MNNVKRRCLLIMIVVGMLLTGCHSHVSIGYKARTHKSNQQIRMQRDFWYSTGTEKNSFTVKEPGEYSIQIKAKMEDGQVRVTLSNGENVLLEYAGSKLQEKQTITLEEGLYLITLEKKGAKKASLTVEILRK